MHETKLSPTAPANRSGVSPEFLDKDGVAALLGVSRRTVDNLVARRELPVVRLSRRLLRFPRTAVLAAMESRTTGC